MGTSHIGEEHLSAAAEVVFKLSGRKASKSLLSGVGLLPPQSHQIRDRIRDRQSELFGCDVCRPTLMGGLQLY
jgi:hypothetical protein